MVWAQRVCCTRGLTFEVSGPRRRGAWAVWTRINHTATRPRRHAVAGPLDRGVRPHFSPLNVRQPSVDARTLRAGGLPTIEPRCSVLTEGTGVLYSSACDCSACPWQFTTLACAAATLARTSTARLFIALLSSSSAKVAVYVFAPQALNTGLLPSVHSRCCRRFEALVFVFGNDWRSMATNAAEVCLWGLTFELSGRQRQDARTGLAKMYRVPPDRAWWPAVGAPLERGVRHHSR